MITKISANNPDFQARLRIKRKIPAELSELLENTVDILPNGYTIQVKNNWILNTLTNSGKPLKKGNFDVSVYKKSGLFKKDELDKKSYSWIKYKNEDKNNFLNVAVQIHEQLYNLKDKLFKNIK